ncbi:MAG: peptide ABC transporter substrate-binding protein [Parasporobacterium sp.]|nr:peptide ABC transporter substrate-binding protein [Parasporobacterium sp.]
MKKFRKLLVAVLSVMMIATLFGTVAVSADQGGDIYVMFATNVMSLDTNLATDGDSFEIIADCIDGLTQMDAEGAAIPAIAESWDVSEDGCTYTFHLREDANWTNGEPVTANDFVFAWKLAMTANVEYNYMFDSSVGAVKNADAILYDGADPDTLGVTAIDDKTLQVELEVPVSFFPSLMYFPTFYPINQAFYESMGDGEYGTSPSTFLGNGAFMLSDYVPGAASMTVVKNPDYYDADKVSLDSITYQVVGSSDQALTGFKSNNLDIAVVSGDQVAAVEADAALAENLKVTGAGYMWYVTFSQTENPSSDGSLANTNLRLAISNSIDRESLVDNYVMDGSLATYTAVPPQFAASATTGEDFSADQTKFAEYIGYDVEKANGFYEAAKEELGKDSFQFTMIYGNNEGDEVAKVAQAIKEQVEAALPGITIDLQAMTKAERLEKMQNDDYCIALTRWGPDYADPMTYLGMWVTNTANNYGFWSNAEYDQLIKDCTSGAYVSDYDARWQAMYDAETLVLQEAVIAPLYTKANANLIASGLQGVEFHPVALNRVYKNATFSK